MTTALEAIERLREGNQRFTSGVRSLATLTSPMRLSELVEGQRPFAVILGCSDSRVPVETIFDQGMGDLFVIRVAGNIVAPSQVGSVEFAAERFGSRLVVVMGHSHCGAIQTTIDQLRQPRDHQSEALRSIVERIRPGIETLMETDVAEDELVHQAMRANVRMSVNQLRHGSKILEHHATENGLMVVGAEYALETGEVTFFDV